MLYGCSQALAFKLNNMLKFNDFLSELIPLLNGTTQGDPSSMTYYGLYNAPLIEMATLDDKLSPAFIDNSMVLAIADMLEECHTKLKDMMEHPDRGFAWSLTHSSPLKLSKTALMSFPRSFRDPIPGPLSLNRHNLDGLVITLQTHLVASYKYLGVLFDPKSR